MTGFLLWVQKSSPKVDTLEYERREKEELILHFHSYGIYLVPTAYAQILSLMQGVKPSIESKGIIKGRRKR